MRKILRLLLLSIISLLVLDNVTAQQLIKPGNVWPDDKSNHIQAHGGGIIQLGKYFYWYGEQRRQGLDTGIDM